MSSINQMHRKGGQSSRMYIICEVSFLHELRVQTKNNNEEMKWLQKNEWGCFFFSIHLSLAGEHEKIPPILLLQRKFGEQESIRLTEMCPASCASLKLNRSRHKHQNDAVKTECNLSIIAYRMFGRP